jgi:hypothetical protein
MSETTDRVICPGSGEFVRGDAVNGNGVVTCPRCRKLTLAEPMPSPIGVQADWFAVWVHAPLVTAHGVHGITCAIATEGVCSCGGRGLLGPSIDLGTPQ